MRFRILLALTSLLVASTSVGVAPAAAADPPADLPVGGSFVDDDLSVHEGAIEAITAAGITRGCHDVYPVFCADESVSRGQMAAFLERSFDLAASERDMFDDDDSSIFESDIAAVAAAGITRGCNPPENDSFCPDASVTRGQMASFLARAMGLDELYPDPGVGFVDTAGSVFELDIARLAAARVTLGCNPPDNTRFCPDLPVTRAQMATFLARALDLDPIVPPRDRPSRRWSPSRRTTHAVSRGSPTSRPWLTPSMARWSTPGSASR